MTKKTNILRNILFVLELVVVVLVVFKLIPKSVALALLGLFFIAMMVVLFMESKDAKNSGEDSEKQALGLINEICTSMDILVKKSVALPEKNIEDKKKIDSLNECLKQMCCVGTIDAAKLEQELLMNITQISSLCDSVVAGSDDTEFKKLLSVIENQVRERKLREPETKD